MQLDRLAPGLDAARALCEAPFLLELGPREWARGLVRLKLDVAGGGSSGYNGDALARARSDPALLLPAAARWRWVPQSKKKRGRWRKSIESR